LRGVWQKFELIDANQDGRISRAELAQYRQQSKQRRRAGTQAPEARTSVSEQLAEQSRRR
jgi:Ca2+-binding EF-hand superfamily protein